LLNLQTSNQTKAQQRSAKLIHDMALEEDATVFQYDEVYDEIEKKKENLDEKKKQIDKKV
jgi:coiled-coil domain-containing protein 55